MSVENDLIRTSVNFSKFHTDTIRGTLLSFTKRVIKETPVDTGRLRGNWQSSLNVPQNVPIERVQKTKTSGVAVQESSEKLSKLNIGDIFWFTNNLPYARRIEEGWSKQAPAGMLRTNFALLASKLK
tara:strand:- start:468 stop:848 length:381 start_codon:yes stop_codon:yes gene_type:complete